MRSPDAPVRRGEPARLGDLIGQALSPKVQSRLIDFDRIRDVWDMALPAPFAGSLTPEAFERGILRLRASSPEAARNAKRARARIRDAVRHALHLPGASLRVSIVAPRGARRASRPGAVGGGHR